MTGLVASETLTAEPRARRRPWLRRVVVTLLVLVAIAGVAWVQRIDERARVALGEGFAASESEARAAEGRVEVAVDYVAPALWRTDLPVDTEDALWQVVREQADAAADQMSAVRARIDGITVLPWRADQRQARDALIVLVAAQEDRFRSMAQDVRRVSSYLSRGPVPMDDAARALRSIGATIR